MARYNAALAEARFGPSFQTLAIGLPAQKHRSGISTAR